MDLQRELIESNRAPRSRGKRVRAYATSIAIHAMLVAGILYAGSNKLSHKIDSQTPIEAFISQGAAPPPPPPPPPPPKKSGGAQPATPRVQPKPVEVPKVNPLTSPVEIPKEIPLVPMKVLPASPVIETASLEPASGTETGPGDATNGVPGGVEGGVAGGVVGGEIGGVKGGEIGGVPGGDVGGTVGGTGTGTAGEGTGGDEAPPSGPLRVGGNVKAPVAIARVKPDYTDAARKAKITGTVVVEAIIDTNGNVKDVRVIKGLPMGLGAEAEEAVKKWKFKPGTLNGEPVAVIFNLTVTFTLG